MQNLEKVPCLNVTKENLADVWPSLISQIATSSFIGIDFVRKNLLLSFLSTCCNENIRIALVR